jgi:hypothetical protein
VSDEAPEQKPEPKPKPKRSAPDPRRIEAEVVAQLAREVIESIGADAVLVVWTSQRRRRTSVNMTSLGNALTVRGLMQWIAAKVEEEEEEEEDEADDGEDDGDE